MTPEQLQQKLIDTIAHELRHPTYDEAVKVAQQARKLMTRSASDQYAEITKYRIRESEEQKQQRARLTNPITNAAIAPVYGYFSEIKRVDGISMHIQSENENVKALVKQKYSSYFHGSDLYDYLFDALLNLNKYDPNAWIIFTQEIVGDTVNFYPLEASSKEVLDYKFNQNGQLQYLTARFYEQLTAVINGQMESKTHEVYLTFGAGSVSHAIEVLPSAFGQQIGDEYERAEINGKIFALATFTNPTTEVPAFRAAAYMDAMTGVGELPIVEAVPILHDLIRDKSYLDTNKTVQTFPRRKEYVKRCDYEHEDGRICMSGYLDGVRQDDCLCPNCKGTGKKSVTSEQDVLTLAWPDRPEDLLELEKLSYTEQPDITLPTFLREEVERAKQDVFRAVFNQETVDKTMTVQTATEIRIEYDKIYNKLMPFANQIARAWELAIRVGFEYLGDTADHVEFNYPYDFKLKSVSELIDEYGRAKNAGLPYSVLRSIQSDLINKQYRNSPQVKSQIEAIETWKPWRDKTTEEIAMIISGRSETDTQRILWENWSEISSEIMRELPDFYRITPTAQKSIIDQKAQDYINRVQYRTAPPMDAQLF